MKTATINFKTDLPTKLKAQDVAKKLGIPLSNLLNAYLYELAATGSVHFSVVEVPNEKTAKLLSDSKKQIKKGDYYKFADNKASLDFLTEQLK